MTKKSIIIFNRKHVYDFTFELENDLNAINALIQKISEPFILSYCGFEIVDFYIKEDNNCLGSDLVDWIFDTTKVETDTVGDIRACILKNSIEDTEWTKKRNEGYNAVYYRQAIFLPERQKIIKTELLKYKALAETMLKEWLAEEENEKREKELFKNKFTIIKVHKLIKPKGGENGQDGYFDADITNGTETVRYVARNVFDFGFYTYPKRVEGMASMFNEELSEIEKEIRTWLHTFSPFTTAIRM